MNEREKALLFNYIVEGDTQGIRDILRGVYWERIEDIYLNNNDNLMKVAIDHYRCNSNVINTLVKCGFDIDEEDYQYYTPLMYACKTGNLNIIRDLIQAGARIDIKNSFGETPLMYACEIRNLEVVRELIGNRANVNMQDKEGKTALMYACETGNIDIVRELIGNEVIIDAQDRFGWTPLMYACIGGKIDIARELIKAKVNVNVQTDYEMIPLMFACRSGNFDLVEELIQAGAAIVNVHGDADIKDARNKTLLMYACESGNLRLVERLIQAGANVNAQDKQGRTPLMYACGTKRVAIVNRLIQAKADVNIQDEEGKTALTYIYMCGKNRKEFDVNIFNIIRSLIENGKADININDWNYLNILSHAISDKAISVVRYLITCGARIKINRKYVMDEGDNNYINNIVETDSVIKQAFLNINDNWIINNGFMVKDVFRNVDFDDSDTRYLIEKFINREAPYIGLREISNRNRDSIIRALEIALNRINVQFGNEDTLMQNFINTGIAKQGNLSQQEKYTLLGIATELDNALTNGDRQSINNCVNRLLGECKSHENVYRLMDTLMKGNVVDDFDLFPIEITARLNELGFHTEEFYKQMQINKIFTNNKVNDRIEINGGNIENKSIINKFFELMYRRSHRAIIQNRHDAKTFELTIRNLDALSKDLDINNACLEYQQNPTEEKKQNLTRVIFEKVALIRNLQVERQLINQFIPNRFRINGKNENITGLINASMNNDFGTYLFQALRTGLQNEFDWENAQQRLIREQQNARQRNNFNNIAQAANNFQQINRDIGILDGRNQQQVLNNLENANNAAINNQNHRWY